MPQTTPNVTEQLNAAIDYLVANGQLPARFALPVFCFTWVIDETAREGVDAMRASDIARLDDAALDALQLLLAYFALRGTRDSEAALRQFERAQVSRGRNPSDPAFRRLILDAAGSSNFADHLRAILAASITRPKSEPLITQASLNWNGT